MNGLSNIINEPSANEPSHRRLPIADYLDMLSASMGALATQQARILRAQEQAMPRYATIVFQANEVDVAPAGGVPLIPLHAKDIPSGDWRSVIVSATYSIAQSAMPAWLLLDEQAHHAIAVQSPIVYPVLGTYRQCALALTAPGNFQGLITVTFTNRELYIRS